MTGVPAGSPTFTYGYTYTQAAPGDLRIGATSGGGLKEDSMPYTVTRNASGANPALVANRTYEGRRDVLHKIENSAGGTVVSSYTYTVNPITQRTSVATAGTAFLGWKSSVEYFLHNSSFIIHNSLSWGSDALGRVTRADAPVNASDRAYEYDQIGSRKKTATGSLTLPAGDNWVANALNQYSIADGVALPTTPAPAPFDLDGNMTAGPVPGTNGNMPGVQPPANATDIKWDAENRLVSITIGATTYGYTYDHLSRLITRRTGTTVTERYNYDGWNRIVDYGTSTTSPSNSYTWGLDLSGTLQGAGGVGGLLATRWGTGAHYFPTYDGNGNVSEYLAPTGTVAVHYEYDPFGNLTRLTGNAGTSFAYRFSTKPRDPATGLYYYGYRWFDPYTGRWLNRDPIEEEGGVNLYGFVGSDGLNALDYRGLLEVRVLNVPSTQQGFVDTGSIGQTDDRGGHRWAETRYRTKVEAFVEDHSDGYCKVSARIMMFYTLVVSSDLSFPPGQLEATIAHEIMHFDAMNKRLADIQRRYKPRPDSFTTYSEALRWRHNYEYLLTHAVNAAIRGEGAHRVSDGFGTPEDGLKGYLYTLDPKIKIPAIISTGINRKR